MSVIKEGLRQILPPVVVTLFKKIKQGLSKRNGYSNLDEESIIKKYLDILPLSNKFCVDIAASDGITMSNTLSLYQSGWGGVAVELDPIKFAAMSGLYTKFENVNLVKTRVLPENVVHILKACECPSDFSFLNFDIDSYDYFILEQLFSAFRPKLVCIEINENIPPPISFTVKYDPVHFWKGDHFFGQSISKCYELCKLYNYDIVELHYNNLFIVPKEINTLKALSPEEAYKTGYIDKADRKEKFPWNSDMEIVHTLSKDEGIEFLHSKFEGYKGKFILE